jgi:hypothetical protein
MSDASSKAEENSSAVYRSSNRGKPARVGHSRSGDDIVCSGAVCSYARKRVSAADGVPYCDCCALSRIDDRGQLGPLPD